MKYIKQLDSIRAIAVILVICSHLLPSSAVINFTPNGIIGVTIFFVLSGFLITKILLDDKNLIVSSYVPISTIIKNFYAKRTLRIFPIYYLTIFGLLLVENKTGTHIKSAFIYFLTYTSNIYFFNIRGWDETISHLWSLAVEEQFYLIWPWIILLFNKKHLLKVITLFILIGSLSQLLMYGVKMSHVLTFTCIDAFGIGALLSWQITFKPQNLNIFLNRLYPFAIISLILFFIEVVQKEWSFLPLRTTISVLTLYILTYILLYHETEKMKFRFILNNRFFIFLGKISYGMYLYHMFVPELLYTKFFTKHVNSHLPYAFFNNFKIQIVFFESLVLLILISWLSYILIEMPFLKLKKYFYAKGKYC